MRLIRVILSAFILLLGLLLFFIEMELAGVLAAVMAFFLFPSGRGSTGKSSGVKNRSHDNHYYHTDHDDDRDDDDWDNDHDSHDGGDSDSGGSDD